MKPPIPTGILLHDVSGGGRQSDSIVTSSHQQGIRTVHYQFIYARRTRTLLVNHAMTCHMGGFPTIRHNEIRDITASLLTEVCHNVATEPQLQPLSGESMTARSANIDDGARTDVRARGFWNASQDAFFDVRVFYPNASCNRSTGDMNKPRNGNMVNESEKSNAACSPLLFSLQLVAWEGRHQPFTNALQT